MCLPNLDLRCSDGADIASYIFFYKAIGTYGANESQICITYKAVYFPKPELAPVTIMALLDRSTARSAATKSLLAD